MHMDEIGRLAQALGIDEATLSRHLLRPLAEPVEGSLEGWNAPATLQRLHTICDGFRLFGKESWDSFSLLDAEEYGQLRDDYIFHASKRIGVVPIFGDCPHFTSVRVHDGAVVSTDWEGEGDEDEWLRPIAPSIGVYVATVIQVREAYGFDDDPDGRPSDWWYPYAAYGDRPDLERAG